MNTNALLDIPAELRALNQWCLWAYEDKGGSKPTKVPYQPNGELVSVTNPSTWSSFDQVFSVHSGGSYSGIGFIFSDDCPYAFIDLDECSDAVDMQRQIKIYQEFDSYSEISPSGKGLHIIVKGKLPQGRRRSSIEIYSSQRYATMTGNIYSNKPIADRNELLNLLFKQMGSAPTVQNHTGDEPQRDSDEEIIDRASSATNGDKFIELLHGRWQDIYSSQSEADFAFIDIVAFYTQNRNQISRLFKLSALGKRAKANRKDYVEWMINKSFDRLLPKLDFDGFRIALEEKLAVSSNGMTTAFGAENGDSIPSAVANGPVAQRLEPSAHNGLVAGSNPAGTTIHFPPGLVGEIAQFIYDAAPRPVHELALAGALGLMAGICGRAYNLNDTGLNLYILTLAKTGVGKDAMASGINKLMNEVQKSVPVASEFIGPSEIASGQALIKYLANKSQSFVSIIGEFGLRMQMMSDPRANQAEKTLQRMLLELYHRSGKSDMVGASAYADKDKNTVAIKAPAFSILAESTQHTLYEALNDEMIRSGLLPRFLTLEYSGERQFLNYDRLQYPSEELVKSVSNLTAQAKTIMSKNLTIPVTMTEDADKLSKEYDVYTTMKIRASDSQVTNELWNRAHIKVGRLAALASIGINWYNPVIVKEAYEWAINIVNKEVTDLARRFEVGEIGKSSEETKQISEVRRMLKLFVTSPWGDISKYCKDERLYHAKLVPSSYISQRLTAIAAFRTDKMGASNSLKRAIQTLIDGDYIREVPRKDMIDKFGTTAKTYQITDNRLIE